MLVRRSAVACGESPLGYTIDRAVQSAIELWLVGNRRSDTLVTVLANENRLLWLVGNRRSDTLLYRQCGSLPKLWLVGNRRSDTLVDVWRPASRPLWLVGNRRSDTLNDCARRHCSSCGLWGIAARIH